MTASPTARLHGLDALRGFALLLGVVLHASMAFLPGPFGIPIWVVQDVNADGVFGLGFYIPHIFRMVLFFLLAGFFARMAYEKRGAIGFALDRVKRIALPLLTFWMPIFTAIVIVLIWSAVKANGGEMPAEGETPTLNDRTFPLTHLWFLYLLCLFYPIAILARIGMRLIDRRDWVGGILDRLLGLITLTPLGFIILGAPLALAFMHQAEWAVWFGIPTPDTGLYPNPVALTGYGMAFSFGWLLHRRQDLLQRMRRFWPVNLAIAIGLTAACLSVTGIAPSFQMADTANWQDWAYAFAYAAGGFAWSFGLIGLAQAVFVTENRTARYVADASYWVYIIHLPMVMAMQVAFSGLLFPAIVKLLLINAITLAICFGSYHILVRRSWLGAWLNGRRAPKRSVNTPDMQPASASA